MKLQRILPIMLVGALALNVTSCKKDPSTPTTPTTPTTTSRVLTGDVTSDMTLDYVADSPWTLKGYVYIKSGATLTIQPGTVVKSDIIDKGALIFERGSKINAQGTAALPIVFTSGVAKGQRRPGDWGGIILLGKATTNRSTEPTIEGGVGKNYGGNDDNDNSGIMKYCRVEYAGIAAEPGSEINGISFGAVGKGTTIDYVQVSYGNDDACEFFGGAVNCTHMIAFSCLDDDYDFDFGYHGAITNAISFKHPQFADPGDASNGIESDNDGTGTSATPFTHPVLKNFTMVGPNNASNTQANHNFGNRWRRASQFEISNSIIMGFQKGGFSMESKETADAYFAGTSKFSNNLVHAIAAPFKAGSGLDTATQNAAAIEAKAIADGCEKISDPTTIGLTNPFDTKAPNFAPLPGSKAATKGVGAIQGTDWTQGWTNWDPNNANY